MRSKAKSSVISLFDYGVNALDRRWKEECNMQGEREEALGNAVEKRVISLNEKGGLRERNAGKKNVKSRKRLFNLL